jgi:hypothetical protein
MSALALTAALLLTLPPGTRDSAAPGADAVVAKAAQQQANVAWSFLTAEQRAALLTQEARLSFQERLLSVSERFLGTPYLFSPLGEGQGLDPDPPFRVDAVDCLSFVEQALAMSLAPRPEEVPVVLEHLRYASTPSYEDRNHLMESQWLPNNLRKGFLVDVTRRHGATDTVRVEKTLTARTWTSRSSLALQLPKERQPQGTYALDMIPLDRVMAHARSLPSGTILVVLREDLPLKATRVTHLGFVVQKGKRTYLRHAARSVYQRVVDEDLEAFLARHARYAKWKVSGVSLFEARRPVDQASARSAAP